MRCGDFNQALKAGLRVYGLECLHRIATNNLSMATAEHRDEVVQSFSAMANGSATRPPDTDADWDSLRSRFGGPNE